MSNTSVMGLSPQTVVQKDSAFSGVGKGLLACSCLGSKANSTRSETLPEACLYLKGRLHNDCVLHSTASAVLRFVGVPAALTILPQSHTLASLSISRILFPQPLPPWRPPGSQSKRQPYRAQSKQKTFNDFFAPAEEGEENQCENQNTP